MKVEQCWYRRGLCLTLVAFTVASLIPLTGACAQSPRTPRPQVALPAEAAGIDALTRALLGSFDQVDVVALGEAHEHKIDSDIRIALVRHPDFAKRVRAIVIECASVTEQATLDRYIRGESVARAQLARVWQATAETTNGFCDAPIYLDFLTAVRDVNARLPASARLRVWAGHPGPKASQGIEATALGVVRARLEAGEKVLLIFGSAHFYLDGPADYYESMNGDIGLARLLNRTLPGRTLTVIPIGDMARPPAVKADTPPDYGKFDRAVTSPLRPVLLSLQPAPFRDLPAEEFLGRTLTTCRRSGGCQSVFKGTRLTLGQMADAAIYVGGDGRRSAQRQE